MLMREIAFEAAANVRTGVTRAVWLMIVLTLGCTGFATLDATSIARLIDEARTYQRIGASIWIVRQEGGVSGAACDALGRLPGVRAAGALHQEKTGLVLPQIGDNPLTWFVSSPGFAQMLPGTTGQVAAGPLVSNEVAALLGVWVGDPVIVSGQPVQVGGIYEYPPDGRPPGMGYAAITPTRGSEVFDECWLDLFPADRATRELLFTTVRFGAGSDQDPPRLRQHNSTLGEVVDFAGAFYIRPTRWAWFGAAALGFALGITSVWRRRLEHAEALHLGQSKAALTCQTVFETAAWVLPACCASLSMTAVAVATLSKSGGLETMAYGAVAPVAGAVTSVLGATLGAASTSEKRLYTLFKAR